MCRLRWLTFLAHPCMCLMPIIDVFVSVTILYMRWTCIVKKIFVLIWFDYTVSHKRAPFYILLLARYVPDVERRSIWDQCKKKYSLSLYWRPTTDQRPHIWKTSNGHYIREGSSDPLHMFGSTVGFSGTADRMALFPVWPHGENHARGVVRLVTM